MVKEVYLFSKYNMDFAIALMNVIQNFPCFVETKEVDEEWIEVSIKCRVEDVASIERMISKAIWKEMKENE